MRHDVLLSFPEKDDEEFDVSHILALCIKLLYMYGEANI
jgi:hypothetical protein